MSNCYRTHRGLILVISIIFLLIPFLFVVKSSFFNCFHASDFSIYQQAFYQIAYNFDLNPYITVRNVEILNDHFDPIIYLGALWVKLFGYTSVNTAIFIYVMALLAPAVYLYRRGRLNNFLLAYYMALILLSKGISEGLQFPIHPTTWTTFPILILFSSLLKKDDNKIILSSIFLFTYKEIFPIAIICVSFYLLVFEKRKKVAVTLLLICGAWLLYVLKLRHLISDYQTVSYSGRITDRFFADPVGSILAVFNYEIIKNLFKLYLPFTPLLYLVKKSKCDDDKRIFIYALLFLAPIVAIQVYMQLIGDHYSSMLLAPIIAVCVFLNKETLFDNRKVVVTMCLFVALAGMGRHTRSVKRIVKNSDKYCLMTSDKEAQTKKIEELLENNEGSRILATGGVIPRLLKPNMDIYQAVLYSKHFDSYDFLILEKNQSGRIGPFNPTTMSELIANCSSDGTELFLELKDYNVYKNPQKKCLELLHRPNEYF